MTITGAGGVSKTRLAFHVAAEMLTACPDGAWVAELASVEDGDGMVEVIARSVGASKRSDASLTESILESLRAKKLLVVLDNCEHLLGEVAGLVEDVVARCPDVRVLATSREGLGVAGERIWPLRSLATPAPKDSTAALASTAAVQLSLDRATAVVPDFALTDSNAPAIGEIWRRLDGIPLAIELAAARTPAMQPQEVAANLDERFRLLTGGRRRGIERHQTLRAMVDWSYSLLGERERTTFDRLGVFAGSFDASAAQSVVSDEFSTASTFSTPLTSSWPSRWSLPSRVWRGRPATCCSRFCGSTRSAAWMWKGPETGSAAVMRAYYAEFIERVAPELFGPGEIVWRARIGTEIDDLRSAVTWALDREDPADAEYAMRIIGALMVESVRLHGAGIGRWAERAMHHQFTKDSPHRDAVLVAASIGAMERLDLDAVQSYLDQVSYATVDTVTSATAETMRGNLMLSRGDLAEADRIVQTALDTLGDTTDDLIARTALCTGPIFAVLNGDIERAEAVSDEVIRAWPAHSGSRPVWPSPTSPGASS